MDKKISMGNDNYSYIHIYLDIKKKIMSGYMKANELLPSVRELSQKLQVSCGTIQKAYMFLKKDGYIYSIPGRGYFVSSETIIYQNEIEQITSCWKQIKEFTVKHNLNMTDFLQIMLNLELN